MSNMVKRCKGIVKKGTRVAPLIPTIVSVRYADVGMTFAHHAVGVAVQGRDCLGSVPSIQFRPPAMTSQTCETKSCYC